MPSDDHSLPAPLVFTLHATGGDKEGYPILIRRHAQQRETHVHEHVFHELVFIESGSANHLSVEGSRRLVPGDILAIRPRMWHRYVDTRRFGLVNVLFDRSILLHQKTFLSLATGAFELFQKPVQRPDQIPPVVLHASPVLRRKMTHLLDAMIAEREEKQTDWQGALIAYLLNLIVIVSRLHHNNAHPSGEGLPARTLDLANNVMVHLEKYYQEKIVLSELAERFHVSAPYLSRIFTRRTGMGIVDYVNHLRIEAACHLLRTTDLSASQIASEIGYDEVPYFFRRFKREVGKSPGQYRGR